MRERIISKEQQEELRLAAKNADAEKKIKIKIRELAIESLKATDEEFPKDYK